MSHSDELNVELARLYAWKLGTSDAPLQFEDLTATATATRPAIKPAAAESPPAVLDDETMSAEQLVIERAAARTMAKEMSEAIERLFASLETQPVEAQRSELLRILDIVSQAGLGIVALGRYPRAFIRLARLCNRYWPTLSESTRDSTTATFFWMQFDHPEASELLAELAESGNWSLGQRLSLRLAVSGHEGEKLPGFHGILSRRLLEILRRADTLPHPNLTRLLAVDWLGLDLSAESVPALAKLLRLPHLGIRWRALDLLLDGFSPCPVRADDVLFLLQDLFVRLPQLQDRKRFEEALRYADCLQRAIVKVRPTGGAELLEEVICHGWERDLRYTECNEQWALQTLSAAYPERALSYIDAGLRNSSSYYRLTAVAALAQLPKELCQPRLLKVAGDGAPRVAERARSLWLEHYDGVCPATPLAGFPIERLPRPPSEHFHGRLAVLRSPSEAARQAMLEALFALSPDEEALYLIVYALSDDTLLPGNRRRLPREPKEIILRLYRKFGAPAVAALCWLAERYPHGAFTSWLFEMTCLVEKGGLRKRDLGPLRSLAVRWLDDPHTPTRDQAFRTLARVGVTAEYYEALRDRLFACLAGPRRQAVLADGILRAWGRDAVLDRKLVDAALAAQAARDSQRFTLYVQLGFSRRIPALTTLAREFLDTWLQSRETLLLTEKAPRKKAGSSSKKPTDRHEASEKPTDAKAAPWPSLHLVNQCSAHLAAVGKISRTWILSSLRAPKTAAFVIAAHLQNREPTRAARAALFAALDPAVAGQKAAEVAATALLRNYAIFADDPRLEPILANADRSFHRHVLFDAAFRICQRPTLSPFVLRFLETATLADLEDLERVFRVAIFGADQNRKELCEKLALIPDEALRAALLSRFPDDSQPAPGWLDDGDALVL